MKKQNHCQQWILLPCLLLILLLGISAGALADNLPINDTYFPDSIFQQYIKEKCDTNGDGFLNADEIIATTSIDCGGRKIASIQVY